MFSFENLRVYKAARQLVRDVYLLQNQFPKEERYALGDQVRRAATSITANLAEGSGRQSPHGFPSTLLQLTDIQCFNLLSKA